MKMLPLVIKEASVDHRACLCRSIRRNPEAIAAALRVYNGKAYRKLRKRRREAVMENILPCGKEIWCSGGWPHA